MIYYTVSKFYMLVPMKGTMKMGTERTYYTWVTPYPTKEKAEEAATYIKENSRAFEVKVMSEGEYEKM